MSKIVIFETNKYPLVIDSANTGDYATNINAVVNPDLSAVAGIEPKYWKLQNGNVVPMTNAEKNAVDAADLQARKDSANNFDAYLKEIFQTIIDIGNQKWSKGQTVTYHQVIDAVKAKIS